MLQPFFAHTANGKRLYLHHPAQPLAHIAERAGIGTSTGTPTGPRALVLYVHPFAEEMNKARRMAALQARALAAAGCEVLQLDLEGCGDSEGELATTGWAYWLDDIAHAAAWLKAKHPHTPLWLWGLRAGALLAVEAARLRAPAIGPCHLLLWQPVVKGQVHLQQFLRLLTAGALDDASRRSQAELKAQLQQGQPLEIAGYTLAPAVALGMEAATLAPLPLQGPQQLLWLETSTRDEPALLPASLPVIEAWKAMGWAAQARAVHGPAFWQTTEIEDAPELLQATLGLMMEATGPTQSTQPAQVGTEAQPTAAALPA